MLQDHSSTTLPPLPDPVMIGSGASSPSAADVDRPFDVDPVRGRPEIDAFRDQTVVRAAPWFHVLRCGCYLLSYKPNQSRNVIYDGTLRVECPTARSRTASGDLYQRPPIWINLPGPFVPKVPILGHGPNPGAGIPILPRRQYRSYLRVTQIAEWLVFGNTFTLGFDMHRFNAVTKTWTAEKGYRAQMSWISAPAGYPSSGDYLEGDVRNASGVVVGRLTMGWISEFLRKATVEIDRVSVSETPLDNGGGADWRAVGRTVGWDITVDVSDADVAEPSGQSWSDAEAHAEMIARRDSANLDSEWRYHVLCVRRLDSTERGIMYDAFAGDSNNIPREGAVISSHWVIPNTPDWGLVQGQRFGASTAAYFRTAVHEIGHAMGLYHNTIDNGYMNTTNVIAASGTAANPFPTNIQWRYAADDAFRLRHMPDVYVRPGGTPFGTSYATTPISPADLSVPAEGLVLEVTPSVESIPLGAPVRVDLRLVNTSDAPVNAPANIGLGSGFTRGEVTDPSGIARTFSPLVLCLDREELISLEPGDAVTNSLTLMRGGAGALFPAPGLYTVSVEVQWSAEDLTASVIGHTTVLVTSIVDEAHAHAARVVLSEPDALLVLAVGGDHLEAGIDAVQTALDDPVLRPHYEYIEARRLARPFQGRPAEPDRAADLLSADTVMNVEETTKARRMAEKAGSVAKTSPSRRAPAKKSSAKKSSAKKSSSSRTRTRPAGG